MKHTAKSHNASDLVLSVVASPSQEQTSVLKKLAKAVIVLKTTSEVTKAFAFWSRIAEESAANFPLK